MARSAVTTTVRWWIGAPVAALVAWFAPVPAWVVEEFYSRDLYPWLQRVLTSVSNLVDFAVLDALIVVALLLGLYRLARLGMTAFADGLFDAAWEGLRRLIRAVSVVVLLFLLLWGMNYRRRPLEEALADSVITAPDAAALQSAITDANGLAVRLRAGGGVNEDVSFEEVATELGDPINLALDELGRLRLLPPGRPKVSVVLGPFFTLAGVNGMLDPFALESIVQADLLPVERSFVLAHEWAHLAGHGDEAEASAVGWLACLKGSPTAAYSASIYLIMEAAGSLPDGARQRALSRLDADVRRDISAISRRMLQQNPQVQRAASRVYDEYLQANRVDDGVASYNRALQLILSAPLRQALTTYGRPTRPVPAPRPPAR